MTGYRPTAADVLAALDVLRDVENISDSLSPDQAIEFREAVEEVKAGAARCIDMLNGQLVRTLDGQRGIVRGDFLYSIGRKALRKRFDHDRIQTAVVRFAMASAVDKETGEIDYDKVIEAPAVAAQAMRQIYVNDSTAAKVTQLDRFGICRDANAPGSVLSEERGDKEVKRTPIRFIEPD